MKPKEKNRGGIISLVILISTAAAALTAVALLVVSLNQNARLQAALTTAQKVQAEQMAGLDARLLEISDRVDEIAPDLERQIASSRDKASSDVGRLESRLNRKLTDIMDRPLGERVVEVPAPQTAAASQAATPTAALALAADAVTAAPEAQEPEKAAPDTRRADEDLPLIRAMKDGTARYQAGRYSEAATLFKSVMDKQPENLDARLYYSASLFKANPGASSNHPQIEQNLKIVLQQRRDDSLAMEVMGLLAAERERWAEAVEWLSQVAAREPENAVILQETGTCAFYAGDYPAAQKYLDQAAAAAPKDASLQLEAGNAYAAAGAHEQAANRYEKCLALDPHNSSAHLKAGLALAALGRHTEALAHLNAYIAVRADFQSLSAAGDCLSASGDKAAAEIRWKQSLDFVKGGAAGSSAAEKALSTYEKIARSAWERADYAACRDAAAAGLNRGPRLLLEAYHGMSLAALGKVQEGNEILRKLIDGAPGSEAAAIARQDLKNRGAE